MISGYHRGSTDDNRSRFDTELQKEAEQWSEFAVHSADTAVPVKG